MPRAPQKINSIVAIDWETSGLDKKEGLHSQVCAATEVACVAIDGTTLQEIVKYDDLIQPYDESLIYQQEAATITGITKEICAKKGIPLTQIVENLCTVFTEANIYNSKTAKPILVAHNWPFDRMWLQDAFRRCEVDLSKYVAGNKDAYGNFIPDGFDSIHLAKMLQAPLTDNDTKFNLGACCEKAGVDLADGHNALRDTVALADLVKYYITRLRSGSNEVTITNGEIKVSHRQVFEW